MKVLTFPYPPLPTSFSSEKLFVILLSSSNEKLFAPFNWGTPPLFVFGSHNAASIYELHYTISEHKQQQKSHIKSQIYQKDHSSCQLYQLSSSAGKHKPPPRVATAVGHCHQPRLQWWCRCLMTSSMKLAALNKETRKKKYSNQEQVITSFGISDLHFRNFTCKISIAVANEVKGTKLLWWFEGLVA